MISLNTQAAVRYLQQQDQRSRDVYVIDRIERALDELLRHPDRTSPAPFQSRSALANGAKVIRHRRDVSTMVSLDELSTTSAHDRRVDSPAHGSATDVVDIYLWLETTPSLTPSERGLLQALAAGQDAESLATRDHQPVARVRERISRARAVGWAAYEREIGT